MWCSGVHKVRDIRGKVECYVLYPGLYMWSTDWYWRCKLGGCIMYLLEIGGVCVIITAIITLIRICVPSLYRRLVILRSGYISCIRALYCTLWLMCSGCSKVFNYAWSNPIDFCFDFKKVFILVWVQPQFTVYMLAVSTGDEHDDIMEASEMTSNTVFKHDLWTNDSWLNWFKFLNIFFSLYICMCEDF